MTASAIGAGAGGAMLHRPVHDPRASIELTEGRERAAMRPWYIRQSGSEDG